MTERGSPRRLAGLLAAALLVLGRLAGPASSGPAAGPSWWEVRLVVTVKGDYALRGGSPPISGEYACRARWEGRLEPDGEDFLLVHLRTEILEWRLTESSGPAESATVLEAPDTLKPELRLNYVLKEGREVEFDFDLEGIFIPLHDQRFKIPLEMSRSAGQADELPGQGYGDFVRRGTNRVVLPASDLSRRGSERTFSWDWRRENDLVKGSPAILLTQSHSVEAIVALTARW